MSLSALLVNVIVGIVCVLIWGVLSYVASSDAEFKSFFVGGLANFAFFIGGVIAAYLAQFVHPGTPNVNRLPVTLPSGQQVFSVITAVYVAVATMLAVIVLNMFQHGFTVSLARLEQIQTVSFTQDGYRDIQVFAGGSFGILCSFSVLIYGLYLGSVRPDTTYLTVLVGVAMSLGIQGLLYVLFGIFFSYQAFQILNVSTPAILGSLGPVIQKLVGLGITAAVSFFFAILWTTTLWSSIKLGSLLSRLSPS